MTQGSYDGPFKIRYSAEFKKVPAVRWQIKGILPLGGITVLHGPPKTYKTYTALSMALSCAAGVPWQGFETRPAKVLYIGAEGFFGLIRRQRAWEQANSTEPVAIALWRFPVKFFNDISEPLLALEGQGYRPDFIIIDTLQRASVGADENSVKDISRVFDNIRAFFTKLADPLTGRLPTGLIVHHDNRAGGYRGSSAIFGDPDGMIASKFEHGRVELSCEGIRDGEMFEPLPILFHPAVKVMTEDGWQTELAVRSIVTPDDRAELIMNMPVSEIKTPQWAPDQAAVLKALAEKGYGFTALLKETAKFVGERGMPDKTLTNPRLTRALEKLQEAGRVEHDGKTYRLASEINVGGGGSVRSDDLHSSSVRYGGKPPVPTVLRTELNERTELNCDPPGAGTGADPIQPPREPWPVPEPLHSDAVHNTNGDGNNIECNISLSLKEALNESRDLECDRLAESSAEPGSETRSSV